jgi:hypothetical protein
LHKKKANETYEIIFYRKASQHNDMAQRLDLPDIVRHACCYRAAAVAYCPPGLTEKIGRDNLQQIGLTD